MTLSQHIIESKDLAEALSYWASALGIVAAIFAGLWVIWKHSADKKQDLIFRARELYDNYIRLSIDYPEFFIEYWKRADISDIDRERYIGFVSYMLNGIEDIILVDKNPEWRESIKADLRFHQDFFRSPYFTMLKECYFEDTQRLIDEVIAEPDQEISYA